MKNKDKPLINDELYIKDIEQLRSSFEYEKKHYENTINKLKNDLDNIYNSRAWKLITKYREFVVSLRPKKDIKKEVQANNFEYQKKNKNMSLIAYIIPGCGMSGGVAVVCQHTNRLKKRGYDVIMISEDENVEIDWFPNQNVEIFGASNSPVNVDIMVATGWSTAYTLEKLNAKEKFYFVQSDETRFFPKGSIESEKARKTYSMDYKFITEAKWIKDWLKKEFNKEAYYVPNGIDRDFMYPTGERYININRKKRVLLEGSINTPYKGMKDAFEAVKDLDCEVWCVSNYGKPKDNWKCDKFFERVPMQEMNFIYSNCDILLKMSRVEGFFGPPMEMMACKGACVVGKVSGYDEYIVDGENALVIEQGDVEAAKKAVIKLLNDDELRNKIAENGYKTSLDWNWESSIDELERIYTSNSNR